MTFQGLLQLRAAYENDGSEALRMAAHAFKGWCRASARRALGVGGRRRTGRSTTAADGVKNCSGEIEGEAEVVAGSSGSAARLTPADAGAWSGPAVSVQATLRARCGTALVAAEMFASASSTALRVLLLKLS